MVALPSAADEPFFEEWKRFHRMRRRSITRAALVAEAMGVRLDELPVMTIVGSKGKATAATYASATLAGAGLRVATITSPPIITNRERIRIDGRAIDDVTYAALASRLSEALRRVLPADTDTGYASPVGLFMIAGLAEAGRQGCDVIVVESGMGGISDEVALLTPRVVAVTPIFGEHLGVLGNTVAEIAENKLGIVGPHTGIVVTAVQSPEVEQVMQRLGRKVLVVSDPEEVLPRHLLPYGLARVSAAVGVAAARRFCGDDSLPVDVLRTVRLPGRLTLATEAGRRWLVDASVDASGVAEAIRRAREDLGRVDFYFVSLPEGKDILRTAELLDKEVGPSRWVPVVLPEVSHLGYSAAQWGRPVVPWNECDLPRAPANVVAVGSWSFMSHILSMLGIDNEQAFIAP